VSDPSRTIFRKHFCTHTEHTRPPTAEQMKFQTASLHACLLNRRLQKHFTLRPASLKSCGYCGVAATSSPSEQPRLFRSPARRSRLPTARARQHGLRHPMACLPSLAREILVRRLVGKRNRQRRQNGCCEESRCLLSSEQCVDLRGRHEGANQHTRLRWVATMLACTDCFLSL